MALRIFHTADWHLGQTFHGYDRDEEHAKFLAWLLQALTEQQPDALLLAGDVFDTVNPSAVAHRRFYRFLAEARAVLPQLQIVVTAGNHDAAARLEAPADLLETLGITVVGTVPRDATGAIAPERFVVPLKNSAGAVEALALAVPFLRPADVPALPDAADPYLDGIRELYRLTLAHAEELRATRHPGAALIALGHCHLAGGEESRDSERRLVIGGSEALRPEIFPPAIAYVALGHLHKPQSIDGGRIRYCGSPIPLSFAERNYAHRVLLVTFEAGQLVNVEALSVPKTASLLRLPATGAATLADLIGLIAALELDAARPPAEQPFLEVHVLDDGPDPTRRRRIEEALAGKAVRLASIRLVAPTSAVPATSDAAAPTLADLGSLEPEALLVDAHREKYHTEPDAALLRALQEILAAEAGESAAPTVR
jgi:exonuclease SbcD